ncbi:MAG: lysophospholipid acyltransferase family protein [Planctomycetota bacterium]
MPRLGPVLAPVRIATLVVVTTPLYLGYALTWPLGRLWPRLGGRLHRLFIGTWARSALRVMGVRVQVEGDLPDGSFFLVGNHLSYLDIPVLLGTVDARFLAKSEVAGWPVLGFLARTTGTLFVDRSRKRDLTRVNDEVRRVLDAGTGVVVFPEATSTKGVEVLPFKPSIFQVPSEMGLPVSCAALSYAHPNSEPPAWRSVCWWGDAPFAPHFYEFLKQPRTDAIVTFGARIPPGLERKELASAAHGALRAVFRPTCPPEHRDTPYIPV